MEIKDFLKIFENKCEAERIHGEACIGAMEAIIKAYNEYDEKELRYSVRAAINSITKTRLAMRSARNEFQKASIKDDTQRSIGQERRCCR